jgi:geranylgeranyl pyrophosphate synthase
MCMVYEYLYVYTHARDNARTRAHTHKHTQVKRLSKFAMNIGLAFQIIDDM